MSVRFAPSPTGTFHLGNLRTAWISHEFARALGMPWIVRFEDIDQPRVVQGAQEKQLSDMKTLGLKPDRILLQSDFSKRHEDLFRRAAKEGAIYPCSCSRKEILESLKTLASAPHGPDAEAPIYNGRCRDPKNRRTTDHPTVAWRFVNPSSSEGKLDFIIARTDPRGNDFVPSYHWACAIDDYDGDHQLLVRASDLAHVVAQQSLIHHWVGESENRERPYPAVFHTSLVVANDGHRLEKRTRGVTLDELLVSGVSADKIIARFRMSFDSKLLEDFKRGKLWGEAKPQLRLAEIQF